MANARSVKPGFRFVDLFAGVGGFHHALQPFGGKCVLAVELDEECRRVYRASFPEMAADSIQADIRSLTRERPHPDAADLDPEEIRARVPEHDVLCAGFPCQPFSKSGEQQGLRDRTRGTLFFDIMSIVLARRPQFLILENVRNLAGPRHEDTWRTIVDSLREAGYVVSDDPVVLSPHLLRPGQGGAPQSRERVFVLAYRRPTLVQSSIAEAPPMVDRKPFPDWDPHRGWRIAKYLDRSVDESIYGIRLQERTWLEAWQAFVQDVITEDTLPGHPLWADAFTRVPGVTSSNPDWKNEFLAQNSDFYRKHPSDIDRWKRARWGPLRQRLDEFPTSRRKFEWQARKEQPRAVDRDLESLVVHFRPSGIRVKPPSYLPALVAITQTSVLGPRVTKEGWRRLTPREAARLQSIPFDGFAAAGVSDKAIYRQLGNAVNVGVVRYVAAALFRAGRAEWFVAEASQAG